MQVQLSTALLLFTLPIFSILVPLIQSLANRFGSRLVVGYWSIAGVCVTLGGVVLVLARGVPATQVILDVLSIDSFSVYFAAVFLLVTLLIAVGSMCYMSGDKNFDTYFGLLLLGTFGMMLVAFSPA